MKYHMRAYVLLMVILSIPFILLTLLLRGLYVFCAYIIIVLYAVVWILYKSLWLRTTDLLFALLFPESKEAKFEEYKMEQRKMSEDELKEILEELWKDTKKK
mgnify:CR=1 FL=1